MGFLHELGFVDISRKTTVTPNNTTLQARGVRCGNAKCQLNLDHYHLNPCLVVLSLQDFFQLAN
jgi:hypothetical protein